MFRHQYEEGFTLHVWVGSMYLKRSQEPTSYWPNQLAKSDPSVDGDLVIDLGGLLQANA